MHKKGITEEVAKKRSRRTVKHQRGIVGADLAAIAARRNQTAAIRAQARTAAIQKAKSEKKAKEDKKEKKVRQDTFAFRCISLMCVPLARYSWPHHHRTPGIEAADEGWQGWPLSVLASVLFLRYDTCFRLPPRAKCMGLACLHHDDIMLRHAVGSKYHCKTRANITAY